MDWHKHPDANTKSGLDIEEEVWNEAIVQGALVARGSWFKATKETAIDEIFYRTTFAAAPLDKVEEAIKRFGQAICKSFKVVSASK